MDALRMTSAALPSVHVRSTGPELFICRSRGAATVGDGLDRLVQFRGSGVGAFDDGLGGFCGFPDIVGTRRSFAETTCWIVNLLKDAAW